MRSILHLVLIAMKPPITSAMKHFKNQSDTAVYRCFYNIRTTRKRLHNLNTHTAEILEMKNKLDILYK